MSFSFVFVVPREFGYLVVFGEQTSDAAVYKSGCVIRGSVSPVHALEYEIPLSKCETTVKILRRESSLADEEREVFVEAQSFFDSSSFSSDAFSLTPSSSSKRRLKYAIISL